MNRRFALKSLSAAIALSGAMSLPVFAQETIKVGVLHSLSGTMAISETVLKDTVLMAIDEINAKGGAARQEARAGGGRPGLELAAVRREGAPADQPGQGGRHLRLLDQRVAQVACCRCSRS